MEPAWRGAATDRPDCALEVRGGGGGGGGGLADDPRSAGGAAAAATAGWRHDYEDSDLGTTVVAVGCDALAPCAGPGAGREAALAPSLPAGTRRQRPASWENRGELQPAQESVAFFGELDEGDVGVLRRLHEICFPVKYNDRFYTDLGKRMYQDEPLITQVAHKRRPKRSFQAFVNDAADTGACASSSSHNQSTAPKRPPSNSGVLSDMDEIGVEYVVPDAHLRWPHAEDHDTETVLLGGISAQLRELRENDDEQPRICSASRRQGYHLGCYVLTVATHPSCRRSGIGSQLLDYVIDTASANPACAVVYLHVITYNESALRFYRKHGFQCVETLRDFYRINGQLYDAYLYARFLNDAKPETQPKSFWSTIVHHVSSFLIGLFQDK